MISAEGGDLKQGPELQKQQVELYSDKESADLAALRTVSWKEITISRY